MTVVRCLLLSCLFVPALVALPGCNRSAVPDDFCWSVDDCDFGHDCVRNACVRLPCDGACGKDEFCRDESCISGHGADCSDDPYVCPEKFACNDGACRRLCSDDLDCPAEQSSCNLGVGEHESLGLCSECTFDADCTDPARPLCIRDEGVCVGCLDDASCRQGGAAVGLFCDPATRRCEEGCFGPSECPLGQRCEGIEGDRPGRCIECAPATEAVDCPSGDRPRCHPTTRQCVRCLGHDHCADMQCDVATSTCVQCVENAFCPRGSVCNGFTCEAGCVGGNGGPNCPAGMQCDATKGSRGTCVDCLEDVHCPRGRVCVGGSCEEGCRTGGTGSPSDARCTAGDGLPAATDRCDGDRGAYGRCVQCLSNNHCPSTERCDSVSGYCRCKTLGEPCAATSECGFNGYDEGGYPACHAPRGLCVDRIRCGNGDIRSVSRVCTRAGSGLPGETEQGCPAGFENADAFGVGETSSTRQCVPIGYHCSRL